MPRQNRYNLPMEIFYTLAPFVIIGVLFYFTVVAQNKVQAKVDDPDVTIDVVGQKWSWTFNYKEADNPAVGVGRLGGRARSTRPRTSTCRSASRCGSTCRSPDVIHSFWMPAFYHKLDVVPGPAQQLRRHPDQGGRLRRQVRRALRHLPLGDAVQRAHRQRGRVQRLPEDPGRQGPGRRGQGRRAEANATGPVPVNARRARDDHGRADRRAAWRSPRPKRQLGTISWKWMVTTDHKVIGNLYFITSMVFFFFGGILALGDPGRAGLPGPAVPVATRPTTSSSPCTARSCCCCSRPRCSPASPTRSCRCRSVRRTWRSRG